MFYFDFFGVELSLQHVDLISLGIPNSFPLDFCFSQLTLKYYMFLL